ncbi:hypothetical protein VI817_007540 [Penicillium citrinum]|nr:hypothetical protein VI817_007540 [Penicillium citrinum]
MTQMVAVSTNSDMFKSSPNQGTGNTIYERTSGKASFDSTNPNPPQLSSLCWVASMSKLFTAVSIMQLVERNLLSLEDDARDYVPELRGIQILRGMKIPSAGFVYDSSSPLLQEWSRFHGRTAHTFCGSMEGYTHPLIFEPATSWAYGAGLDWAGRVVECITDSTLENYMQEHIWAKLGATSSTFHPELHRGTLPEPLEMGHRVSVGQGSRSVKPGPITLVQPARDCLGGIGIFSTAADFIKLLAALLKDGGPLLSKDSTDILFQPQLSDASRCAMPRPLGSQMRRILGIKDVHDIHQADHSLAGTVSMKDIPGRRKAGTVNWSGLPNLHWWIDRKTGVAAALFTQLMPPGDAAVTSLLIELEEATYKYLVKDPATKGLQGPKL